MLFKDSLNIFGGMDKRRYGQDLEEFFQWFCMDVKFGLWH
jgi:hypothetical protein